MCIRDSLLLGLQWGDEGKGKIVDVLTSNYDIIARFQGGPNAGHTLVFNEKKYVLHTIPSGIFHKEKINLIGNGVVIDPVILNKEIENIKAENLSQLDIKIANSYFKNKMVTNLNQNPKGLLLFFPNKSATIKSYILLKVKFREDSLILAMGSKDKNKFTVDMQTDLVEYLIKIIEVNLLSIK